MNFPAIDIQGSVISADLLGKIRAEQATFQQGKDFNKDFTNLKLKDEISLAWQDAKGQWTIFNNKLKRVTAGETAATETRSFWILPLLSNLGYDFQYLKQAEEINGKSFWINNRDNSIGGFPLFIAGYNESIDRRSENKTLRISPHALVQEYLNYSEHLYGLVTNGRQLRLLRDASRLTRLSYVEFNLERIMEEDLYSDFVILYRLLHKSRMPEQKESGPDSIIEKYHQEGLEAGATIRSKLGSAVKNTIKDLANAFINHPDNIELREAIVKGNFNADEYYRQQLRIIYRLLFLFVIEERNLVYADSKDPRAKRFNQIYFSHYSLLRFRKLAKKLPPPEAARHHDLWVSLVSTFSLFETKLIGEKLGIMSLQGDLFSYDAIANTRYDLHRCHVSNAALLKVIKALGYFENEKQLLIAVNYGGLDVEEFGSVYEGLLELKLEINKIEGSESYSVNWKKQEGGREFQSHYTPEELVQPLIKNSLEYIIADRLKANDPIKALLDIKVCDVACGSGHILLSAARKIAIAIARIQTGEEQPNPNAIRKAIRDVISHCIYGVDKNPLAIELCKVAFWLEAHNPGEPLNYLDHHIKCGDAIVGLAHKEELENGIADEAFKALPGDDKEIASAYAKRNKAERITRKQATLDFEVNVNQKLQDVLDEFKKFDLLSENTPDEIETKATAYNKLLRSGALQRLKTLADIQVAQFFIAKTHDNEFNFVTDAAYFRYLKAEKPIPAGVTAEIIFLKSQKRFFHWFLEFPEVFQQGGFDCILGNPPYLGFKKITSDLSPAYNSYIKCYWPEKGKADYVTYFFRRIFDLIKPLGFQALITTSTISQGDTRVVGLEVLSKNNATIIFAIKSMEWPGAAGVDVTILSIFKGEWRNKYLLNGREVSKISALLDDVTDGNYPKKLSIYNNIFFQGSVIRGKGFLLSTSDASALIHLNIKNKEIIKWYYTGDDLTGHPALMPSRQIIDFKDWAEDKCKKYKECWDVIVEKVKPEREKILSSSNQVHENKFWIHWDRRANLYSSSASLNKVLAISMQATKYPNFEFINSNSIYSNSLGIICSESRVLYVFLNSTLHNEWAFKYASLLETRLRYSSSDIFQTFPFLPNLPNDIEQKVEKIGQQYHEHRLQLMLLANLGLTKTYNFFHAKELNIPQIVKVSKQDESIGQKAFEDILKLRELHKQMDETVLTAYGWNDIDLQYNFYEVDYLPEKDRIRYTIHPDARKEILKRLLELNHKIHEEEVKAGLFEKKKPVKEKKTKKLKGADLFGLEFE